MTWASDRATRLLVLLAAVAAVVLGTGVPASPGVGVAVVTATLAALVVHAMRQICLAGCTQRVADVAVGSPVPLRPGRVTDPTHHPLRPRAPGQA